MMDYIAGLSIAVFLFYNIKALIKMYERRKNNGRY